MSSTHPLSRAAYDRLKAEHEDLTTRGRIEIAEAIQRARELGDLSENGDYQAAKDQQGHMEGRIRQLESILENAEIIEASDDGTITVGNVVTIVYDGDSDDMAETYLIDSVEQRSTGFDVITPGSPLGAALIGTSVGELVEYDAPNGAKLAVKVIKVDTI
ncbi:MAG: transcription elongation factor GreA [Ilumatobacteraceae bacterium]